MLTMILKLRRLYKSWKHFSHLLKLKKGSVLNIIKQLSKIKIIRVKVIIIRSMVMQEIVAVVFTLTISVV